MRLARYVRSLIECLETHEPESAARLRSVIGSRVERIALDEEVIDVRFADGQLRIRRRRRIDGEGRIDRATAYDLFDGTLDLQDALASGRFHIRADLENLTRMLAAIEIVIDAATRVPAIRELTRSFRRDSPAPPAKRGISEPDASETEFELLTRLGLAP